MFCLYQIIFFFKQKSRLLRQTNNAISSEHLMYESDDSESGSSSLQTPESESDENVHQSYSSSNECRLSACDNQGPCSSNLVSFFQSIF